jgi:hypothetical protein
LSESKDDPKPKMDRRDAIKSGGMVGFASLVALGGAGSILPSLATAKTVVKMNKLVPDFIVTVSAIGTSQTGIANDGADFGPDTKGTQTNGIQEALNSIASTGGVVYCVNNGTYTISASIFSTGNNQALVFEAGCFLNLNTGGSFNGGGVFYPFSNSSSHNYSGIRWIGNGTTVNTNALTGVYTIFNCGNVSYSSAGSCTSDGLLEGFDVTNVAITGLAMICSNGAGYNPTYEECIRQVILRFISISYASAASSSPSGLYIGGSARQVLVDNCIVDQTGSSLSSADACFLRSQYGNVSHIVFRSCAFIAANSSDSPLEVQGADNAGGCTTEYVTFEDCEFDNGYSFIDDDYGSSYFSYVNNIEFLRCRFGSSTMEFEAAPSNGSLAYGWPLGYVRFVDCYLGAQSWSSFVGSSPPLSNRSPGQGVNITSIFSSGGSGTTYTNGQLATGLNSEVETFDQEILVGGGSGVSISIDGQSTGLHAGSFLLRAGHSITIDFSSVPTVTLVPI